MATIDVPLHVRRVLRERAEQLTSEHPQSMATLHLTDAITRALCEAWAEGYIYAIQFDLR